MEELARAESIARKESVRAARRRGWVEVEGRGKGKRLVRVQEQLWWARLQQRLVALATWALEVRGDTMEWYVRGKGRSMQPEGVHPGGEEENVDGEREVQRRGGRRKVATQAIHATKEGVRMMWWLMQGEGADARGPISVVRGAPRMPTQR